MTKPASFPLVRQKAQYNLRSSPKGPQWVDLEAKWSTSTYTLPKAEQTAAQKAHEAMLAYGEALRRG